jgi:hypothetical protein
MLSTYSVLMMLLLGTGSLVGISSIYTPANVETQPQPQPQKPPQYLGDFKQGPLTKKDLLPTTPQMVREQQDRELLDRLMPKIIGRIDVKLILTQRPGQTGIVKGGIGDFNPLPASRGTAWVKAGCQPGETAVSVGFENFGSGMADNSVFYTKREDPNSNIWNLRSYFNSGEGKLSAYAECLKVQLSLKGAQQPQPQQPPAQPPGGPPLQPPPEFGK